MDFNISSLGLSLRENSVGKLFIQGKTMNFINEIFKNIFNYKDKYIELKCYFIMKNDETYIANDELKNINKSKVIYIDHPGLKKILFGRVPAFGGGDYAYYHEAIISGKICLYENDEKFVRMTDIRKLEIYEHGELLVAIP